MRNEFYYAGAAIGNDMIDLYGLWMARAEVRRDLANEALANGADAEAMQAEIDTADAAIKEIYETICSEFDRGSPDKKGFALVVERAASMKARVRFDVMSGKTRL